MDAKDIEMMIKTAIPDAQVLIDDLRGDGDHYRATVLSPSFAGLSRIDQHKRVNAALKGVLGTKLHALQIITRSTPQIDSDILN